ncbi:50S ribosomal protein L18 [bacterium]|nr:50S ribosomal protein L18 [bacterium]
MSTAKGRKRKVRAAYQNNGRLRLSVYKSNTNIYAQIIDDTKGHTLVASSSIKLEASGTQTQRAQKVGALLAEKAAAASVKNVWFDRGKYKFTGRIKALAEAARAGGLEF